MPAHHTRRKKAHSQLHDVIWDFLHKSTDVKPSAALFKDTIWKKGVRLKDNEFSFSSKVFTTELPVFPKHVAKPSWGWAKYPGFKTRICLGTSAGGPKQSSPSPLSVFRPLVRLRFDYRFDYRFERFWLFHRCQSAKLKSTMSKAPPG